VAGDTRIDPMAELPDHRPAARGRRRYQLGFRRRWRDWRHHSGDLRLRRPFRKPLARHRCGRGFVQIYGGVFRGLPASRQAKFVSPGASCESRVRNACTALISADALVQFLAPAARSCPGASSLLQPVRCDHRRASSGALALTGLPHGSLGRRWDRYRWRSL
jgi:hypothetical protein